VTFKNHPASFLSRFLKNPLLQTFEIFQSSYGNVELSNNNVQVVILMNTSPQTMINEQGSYFCASVYFMEDALPLDELPHLC
jgi:hypothetical protein